MCWVFRWLAILWVTLHALDVLSLGTTLSCNGGASALLLALSTIVREWINMMSFKVNCVLTAVISLTSACNFVQMVLSYSATCVDCVWNLMAHVQKPDFVFLRNGRVHLNWQGASVQSTSGSQGVRISGSNTGYTMLRVSVKGTGYPPHSPVSPSLPLLCVTVCHHISTGLYH